MEKVVGAFEARRQFGRIISDVATRNEAYIVERNGEPVAAVVPVEVYTKWKQRREAFFKRMRAISERVDLPEEEANRLVAEAIEAVRKQS